MVRASTVPDYLKEHVGAAFNHWRHFSRSSCCVKSMRSRRVPQYCSSLSARRREEPRAGNRFIVQQHVHVTMELQDDMVYSHVLLTLRMQPIHKRGLPQEAWRRLLVFSSFEPSFAYCSPLHRLGDSSPLPEAVISHSHPRHIGIRLCISACKKRGNECARVNPRSTSWG